MADRSVCETPIQKGKRKGLPARGEPAGFQRHKQAGEPPCEDCAEGNRAWNRRYYATHRERFREKHRRWREANPVRARASYERWRRANLDRVAEHSRRRTALKREATVVAFTVEQLAQRMSMFAGCWMCGDPDWTEVDHVKPLAAGGLHCLSNLRPACRPCNARKHRTWPWPTEGRPT